MCGIAGILSFNSTVDSNRVLAMTDSIKHRGPDGSGNWSNESQNICLGHRRLAIIDLSEDAAQPMHFANRYSITYNGEIYNYQNLKSDLESKGEIFKSKSDTEVLLRLFVLYGENCLDMIDGMFSFAIWDNYKQELFCARDRFGEKPFCFANLNNEFIFGSEIKELFAAGLPKMVNNERLIRYFATNEIEDIHDKSTTFYEGVFNLEASHFLKVSRDGIEKKKYYTLNFEEIQMTEADAIEKFRSLVHNSVKMRALTSDVPVGTSLSGGVDSSIIFHELNQISTQTRSFTAAFPGYIKDESDLVRLMHLNYNSDAKFAYPTGEYYIKELDKFFYHQDEPVRNANLFAQYCVYELAKQNNTIVLLDGQGADEVLAGYHLYFKPYLQRKLRKAPIQFLRTKSKYKHSSHLSFDKHFYFQSIFPNLYHNFIHYRKYHKGNLSDLNHDFLNEHETSLSRIPFISPNVNDALNYNIFHSGLEQLLRYGDRSSMAHSVEVRLPFLSRELVEFASTLPIDLKINNGYSKYISRASYNGLVPDEILWKKDKIGYEAPQNNWSKLPEIREELNNAKRLLIGEKILNENVNDSKWWQYIQASKLFQK